MAGGPRYIPFGKCQKIAEQTLAVQWSAIEWIVGSLGHRSVRKLYDGQWLSAGFESREILASSRLKITYQWCLA
jgi:hypothetical protein